MGGVLFALLFLALVGVGTYIYIYFDLILPARATAEAKKRVANMSEEEKHELLWGDSWRTVNGSLPQVCPRCGSTNVEKNSIGYPLSKWVLTATKTVEVEKLDKIHRLGGASTAFTKTETKEIKTYKCPKCGYTHTVG